MRVAQEIRKRAGLIAGPVLGISLMCYFGYHLVEGERGLLSWLRLKVHSQGKRVQAQELMQRATGEPTRSAHHVGYLRQKFLG